MKIKEFIKATRIASRILFFVWLFYLTVFLIVILTTEMTITDFMLALIGFSDFFLLPAILIEYKKNPLITAKQTIKPFKSHTIWGIIFLELAPMYISIGLVNLFVPSEGTETIIPMVVVFCVLGTFLFAFGLLLFNGTMTKRKLKKEAIKQELDKLNNQRIIKVKVQPSVKPQYQSPPTQQKPRIINTHIATAPSNPKMDVFYTDGMDGHEFEHFCANLLRKNGFINVSVTPGSGDQGVDILATKSGIKYAIQCKCYASPLSNKPIQEVNAGKMYYNCHVGVVMTNSTFTPGAKDLAAATNVLLWDRLILREMMEKL